MSDDPILWTNEKRKLRDLIPWERNPRQIKRDEAARLVDSLDRFGQVEPIAIGPGNEVYNGHQRDKVWSAAQKYGPNYEVDVRVSSRALTEKEREQLTVYLHKGAAGEWDFDALANEFEFAELVEWGFDEKELLGLDFGSEEKRDAPGAENDRAEELREKWDVQSGQIWSAGEHKIICGDCTDAATVASLMQGERAEIGFTSPPYLDMREYSGNELTLDVLLKFVPPMVENCEYSVVNLGLKFVDGEVIRYWDQYFQAFYDAGVKMLAWNVWDRTKAGTIAHMTNMFCITHEWLFVFGSKRKELNRTIKNNFEAYEKREGKNWRNGKNIKVRQKDGSFADSTSETHTHHQIHSVIQQVPELGPIRSEHPAVFPVELPEQYIEAMTNPGDIVYDPFLGSGTTLVACERLGRSGRGVEISPAYVAVALERLSLMGLTPELVDS